MKTYTFQNSKGRQIVIHAPTNHDAWEAFHDGYKIEFESEDFKIVSIVES